MTAPKTKDKLDSADQEGIQLIVFAPINADPADEDNRIYMVCPSSMRVVEVIEKFGEEAEAYLRLLGRRKKKTSSSATNLSTNIEEIAHITDDIIVDNSGGSDDGIDPSSISSIEDELDHDVLLFANDSLDDIFPDDGESKASSSAGADVDLDSALALLDEEESSDYLDNLDSFSSDDEGGIPTL